MSSKVEKAEECVCISYIATIVHTFLQPFLEKRKKKKGKLQFLLGLAGMELAFSCQPIRRRRRKGKSLWLWHLSSQAIVMDADSLPFREQLKTCLLVQSSERIPLTSSLVCAALAFSIKLIKLPLSSSTSLLFSPHPMGDGSEQAAAWVFGCWLGWTHHTVLLQFWKPAILKFPVIVKNCFLFKPEQSKCSILQIRPAPVWISSILTVNLP